MSELDWSDLRHFLEFARSGSMQAAAKALGVNQSTVQRRISALELKVGHKLTERSLGGYKLTALGAKMLSSAEDIEVAVAAFERRVSAHDDGRAGALRVTCGSNLASRLSETLLIEKFQAKHPGMLVELIISDRFLDLAKGEADIAIRRGEPQSPDLVGRKIANASWAVYGSHSYVRRYGRPENADDLRGHFVIGCEGAIKNYPGAQWAKSVIPPAAIVSRSDSWQGLLLAVKSGAGLAAMPRWQGENMKELVCVIDDIGVTMPYYLLMHRDMQRSRRIRAFADFVRSEIKAFRALFNP